MTTVVKCKDGEVLVTAYFLSKLSPDAKFDQIKSKDLQDVYSMDQLGITTTCSEKILKTCEILGYPVTKTENGFAGFMTIDEVPEEAWD